MVKYRDVLSCDEKQLISLFRRFWKLRHSRKNRWSFNLKLKQMISEIRKCRQ